jgi:hypothetical protein
MDSNADTGRRPLSDTSRPGQVKSVADSWNLELVTDDLYVWMITDKTAPPSLSF